MIEVNKFMRLRKVEDVVKDLEHYNKCVDAWSDAFEWLKEVTKDKRDKKATKAILTKWQTEYRSGHMEQRDLGNGMGWEIYISDDPYHKEKNCIYVNACDVAHYSNGEKYLRPVKDFYTGMFSYDKGSTWQEVLDTITKYVLPKHVTIDTNKIQIMHRGLSRLKEAVDYLEELDNKYYNENGAYIVSKIVER